MPVPVLSGHGVIKREGDFVTLTTKPLSFEQRARVKMICEQRLQEYMQKRGLSMWDYRLLEIDPNGVSTSLS